MPEKDDGMSLDDVRRLAVIDQAREGGINYAARFLEEYRSIFYVPDQSAAIPAGRKAVLARGAIAALIGEILTREAYHA